MRQLLKSSTILGSTDIGLIFIAIIRAKYIAMTIGPEGYGKLSILSSFFNIFLIFSVGWLGPGIVKYVAEYKSRKDNVSIQKIYSFSFSLTFLIVSFLTLNFFIFNEFIRSDFLDSQIIFLHYALFASAFISNSLGSIIGFVFSGLILIKKTAKVRIITTLFRFICFIILIYLFELTGFFLSLLISSVFSLMIYLKESKNFVKTKFTLPKFKDKIAKKLITFGGVNLFLMGISSLSEYFQRYIILSFCGIIDVGLFHVSRRLTEYMGIMNRSANFYNRPKLSEDLTVDQRNKVINDYIRFTFITGIPIAVIAIIFSELGIRILYSEKFLPLSDIFFWFVIAQLIQSIGFGFQNIILGKAYLKFHSFVTVIVHINWVLIPLFLINKLGLTAVALSLIISSLFSITFSIIYLRKKVLLRFKKNNVVLMLLAFLTICSSIFINDQSLILKFCFLIIVFILVALNIQRKEWIEIKNYIKKFKR